MKSNMTQREFAEYFNIPVRTLQNWETRHRNPPDYVVELIKYKMKKERLGMLKLIEKDHGEEKVLKEGTLEEITNHLKENENIINWVLDEEPEMELPELDAVKNVDDLRCELDKVNLDWWNLEVIEAEEENEVLKTVNYLNRKFEGATLFVHDPRKTNYHKTIDDKKELEVVLEMVKEINEIKYDKSKHPFMETQVEEINEIAKMKRLDLKTGWIITKIIKLYEYMSRQGIINI